MTQPLVLTTYDWVPQPPRGYVRDLALWYARPRAYCAVSRDRDIRSAYLREE